MTVHLYYNPQSRAVMTLWLLEELGVSYDLMESNDGAKSKRRIERVFKKAAVGEFTTVLYDGADLRRDY